MMFMNQIFALAAKTELIFELKRFASMLDEMGIGMLVIFILIGVIILSTLLVNRLFSKKDK